MTESKIPFHKDIIYDTEKREFYKEKKLNSEYREYTKVTINSIIGNIIAIESLSNTEKLLSLIVKLTGLDLTRVRLTHKDIHITIKIEETNFTILGAAILSGNISKIIMLHHSFNIGLHARDYKSYAKAISYYLGKDGAKKAHILKYLFESILKSDRFKLPLENLIFTTMPSAYYLAKITDYLNLTEVQALANIETLKNTKYRKDLAQYSDTYREVFVRHNMLEFLPKEILDTFLF